MSSPRTPARLGRYDLVGRLATGGTSTVYLARAGGSGGFSREFALKVLHPHLDSTLHRRFLEEARLSSRVRHPHVVATVEVGQERGFSFLALELIDGVDLRRLMLHRSVPLRPSQAALLVAMVARGLHAVHVATDEAGTPLGVVHRDLSPHNVMIDRDGRAVVIDLGLAKAATRPELTEVGVLCGKLPYMSPEQALLQPVDARSDVFALGTVLYEAITGSLPFGDDDSRQTLERLLAPDAASIAAVLTERGVAAGIRDIVLACLQRAPEDRFASAAEVADALEQELAHAGIDPNAIRRELADMVAGLTQRAVTPSIAAPRGPRWRTSIAVGAVVTATAAVVLLGRTSLRTEAELDAPTVPVFVASDTAARTPQAFTTAFTQPAAQLGRATVAAVPDVAPVDLPPAFIPIPVAADMARALAPVTGHARTTVRPRKRSRTLKPNPYAG